MATAGFILAGSVTCVAPEKEPRNARKGKNLTPRSANEMSGGAENWDPAMPYIYALNCNASTRWRDGVGKNEGNADQAHLVPVPTIARHPQL